MIGFCVIAVLLLVPPLLGIYIIWYEPSKTKDGWINVFGWDIKKFW